MADSLNNINPRDLKDAKDSLTIQEQTTGPLTTNIYEIANYVEYLKQKYIDLPNDTLTIGVFGYISEIGSNLLENAAIMSSEYANESIPTRAKFERNVISHALSLGIDKIFATPAQMEVYLCIPEDRLIDNLWDDEIYGEKVFILDKNFNIHIGNDSNVYMYHIDYDIVIKRNKLRNGKFMYTATYIMDNTNPYTTSNNPYLPNIGVTRVNNTNVLMIHTTIRQTEYYEVYKKILVTNPLESKSLTFNFEEQLSYFYIDVIENDELHRLKCLYDGLYNTEDNQEFCNYSFIDSNNIRITFNRDSYQPRQNAEVTIHYTITKGNECNFDYNEYSIQDLNSNRYPYKNIYMSILPITDSSYGQDKKDVEEIRKIIPKQMLMRNSITTYTDLNNFFNSLNSETVRLYFLQKVHNQLQRLFFCYLLVKDNNNNIVPTNSLDCKLTRDIFSNINKQSYILQPGTAYFITASDSEATAIDTSDWTEDDIQSGENSGFLYICPFTMVINKNPFLLNYYMTILDYSKGVEFEWINNESELQFIMSSESINPIAVSKPFYPASDRDTYSIKIILTQNITSDFNMIAINEDNPEEIATNNMRVIGVVYIGGAPKRWCEATIKAADYDDIEFVYKFCFNFKTNNIINPNGDIMIVKGMYAVGSRNEYTTAFPSNIDFKIFIFGKFNEVYGSRPDDYDIDTIVPGLEEYTLCNIYSVNTGIDLFTDYTNIMESYIEISPDENSGEQTYHVKRVPLVRYSYLDTQSRVSSFIKLLEYRRLYIQSSLLLLEDSFGIDFKFFNTYGPSKNYIVSRNSDRDTFVDRVNVSLIFEAKLQSAAENNIADKIILYIKDYIENINYLSDLHIPNLTTAVKNEFYKQLVYFKFLSLNDYGYEYQSIYKNTTDDDYNFSTTVPEFININTVRNNANIDIPDIVINIVE